VEHSPFKKLLTTDETFYQSESLHLADRAAGMGVPPSEIEDVVSETWLEAVKYGHQFADEDLKKRLHHWLLRVVHSKAVDALRRLHHHPCESLHSTKEEPTDDAEVKRGDVSEWREWLTVRLEKAGAGKEESLRLLCGHFLHQRSIQDLARESGMKPCAIDGRIRRFLRNLRNLAD
jgi:RNA polymerase sigma factor (sigma-70 family)